MKRFENTWFYKQIEPFLGDALFFLTDTHLKMLTSLWIAASILVISIIAFVKNIYKLLVLVGSAIDRVHIWTGIKILEKTLATWLIWYSIKLICHYYSPTSPIIKKLGYSVLSLLICLPISLIGMFIHSNDGGDGTGYVFFSGVSFLLGIGLPVWSNNRKANYYLDRI